MAPHCRLRRRDRLAHPPRHGNAEKIFPPGVALLGGTMGMILAVAGWVAGRRPGVGRVSARCALAPGCSGIALVVFRGPLVMRNGTNNQPCPSRLRQIGQGLQLYAMDHDRRTPDRLEELATDRA
jgi:hypothetical protein